MLRIENLNKNYRTGDQALKTICLTLKSGELVALIGPSGAGKSTLIRCINRLVEPSSGEIYLDDVDITGLNSRHLRKARRRIGMVFQEYALIERLTVMENVLSGQLGPVGFVRSFFRRFPRETMMKAIELLERVDLIEHMNKRADELSGGQRQRVGIARAILQQPELLLVDEPTASLDPRTSRQIMRLICELCSEKNISAMINIHDVNLARSFVNRIVGLRQGEIVFDAGPDKLDEKILTEIYGEEDWSEQAVDLHAEDFSDSTMTAATKTAESLSNEKMHGLT